jgi:hypothetical protein
VQHAPWEMDYGEKDGGVHGGAERESFTNILKFPPTKNLRAMLGNWRVS